MLPLGSTAVVPPVVSEDVDEASVVGDAPVEDMVAELAPVVDPSSSAGHAVRLKPMSTAVAVRTTTPRSLRNRLPQCGHADSCAMTCALQEGQAIKAISES